jgi:hypothetical protein
MNEELSLRSPTVNDSEAARSVALYRKGACSDMVAGLVLAQEAQSNGCKLNRRKTEPQKVFASNIKSD